MATMRSNTSNIIASHWSVENSIFLGNHADVSFFPRSISTPLMKRLSLGRQFQFTVVVWQVLLSLAKTSSILRVFVISYDMGLMYREVLYTSSLEILSCLQARY